MGASRRGAMLVAAAPAGTAAPRRGLWRSTGGGALAKMSATAAPMKPKKGADEGELSAEARG